MTNDPLDTPNGLIAKATKAKREGLKYIETTEEVAKYYLGVCPPEGYFMFHDLKCYIYGKKVEADRRDAMSVEEQLFKTP